VGCPNCGHEIDERAPSCRGCGAPFDLREEPPPALLDRSVELDRRLGPLSQIRVMEWSSGVVPGGPVLPRAFEAPAGPGLDVAKGWDEAPAEEPEVDTAACPPAAPVGRRIAAASIDVLLVALAAGIPLSMVARALPAGGGGFQTVLPACIAFVALVGFTYSWLGHALMSATIGKRCLGLRVAGPDGDAPGLGRSAARAAVATAGLAALGPGALVGLFTRRGKALHDLAAGTSVVRGGR
jgi:uncharacterized RDD family membrane protein YckC